MSRNAAKITMEVVIRNIAEQDAALKEIQSLCTEAEFSEYRLMIGKVYGSHAIRDHKSNRCEIS
jgi:hypothetical protein